jgi:hypothetical protein
MRDIKSHFDASKIKNHSIFCKNEVKAQTSFENFIAYKTQI